MAEQKEARQGLKVQENQVEVNVEQQQARQLSQTTEQQQARQESTLRTEIKQTKKAFSIRSILVIGVRINIHYYGDNSDVFVDI